MPFLTNFLGWEGSPTKIDYRKVGTLIPTSLLKTNSGGAEDFLSRNKFGGLGRASFPQWVGSRGSEDLVLFDLPGFVLQRRSGLPLETPKMENHVVRKKDIKETNWYT